MPESDKNTPKSEIPRGRGIFLLPTSITLLGLFAGFYGIVAATKGQFTYAPMAIFLAMLLDGLDGRIARMTNTQTRFGAELDSISDMVTCGVAPALVVYFWSLHSLGKIGWLISFVYMASVALRLARFNARAQNSDKRFFQGLPSPAGAGILAGLVWLCHENVIYGPSVSIWVATVTTFTALMLVSSIPYRSFKDLSSLDNVPFVAVVAACLIFVLIAMNPPAVLFSAFMLFGLYGPVMKAWLFCAKKMRKTKK